jgi:hypothetical protein
MQTFVIDSVEAFRNLTRLPQTTCFVSISVHFYGSCLSRLHSFVLRTRPWEKNFNKLSNFLSSSFDSHTRTRSISPRSRQGCLYNSSQLVFIMQRRCFSFKDDGIIFHFSTKLSSRYRHCTCACQSCFQILLIMLCVPVTLMEIALSLTVGFHHINPISGCAKNSAR